MCGLTGFFDPKASSAMDVMITQVKSMCDAMIHRGPDDHGEWCDPETGIGLGFRRLAIIDVSQAGHQPMLSASGRYSMVFNGEVYNSEAIRTELKGAGLAPVFRGHSDTEVILAGIEAWGIEATVRRCIGMFAMAIWDRKERRLTLVRDRMGVKPLYYGICKGVLLFGSELKPIAAHSAFDNSVDRVALTEYLRHNYVPSPNSIYKSIQKLPPASLIHIDASNLNSAQPTLYWNAEQVIRDGSANPLAGSDSELLSELDALLRDSVGLRMFSDVPLGVFLSGGIDSSLVTALMQQLSSSKVRSFSIGFHEEGYNEAQHAKAIAKHIGTDHTELYVTPEEMLGVVPKLSTLFDEPFADSSQIPTYLVSAMARQHVTVALSGDGGDELFGGYERYFRYSKLYRRWKQMPSAVRATAASMISAVPTPLWDQGLKAARPILPTKLRVNRPGDKLQRVATMLKQKSAGAIYQGLSSYWEHPERVVIGGSPGEHLNGLAGTPPDEVFFQYMMGIDMTHYLPDDILVKVDRASMGISLEAREPLLDHRLVEFAWKLPHHCKVRDGVGKWILKQALYKYVPKELLDRPKKGFGVPMAAWLRGPLRDWAEALIAPERIRREGFLESKYVEKLWRDHVSARDDHQYALWGILMFQSWLERYDAV